MLPMLGSMITSKTLRDTYDKLRDHNWAPCSPSRIAPFSVPVLKREGYREREPTNEQNSGSES